MQPGGQQSDENDQETAAPNSTPADESGEQPDAGGDLDLPAAPDDDDEGE